MAVDLDPNMWLQKKCLIKLPYLGDGSFYCQTPIEFISIFVIIAFLVIVIYYVSKSSKGVSLEKGTPTEL